VLTEGMPRGSGSEHETAVRWSCVRAQGQCVVRCCADQVRGESVVGNVQGSSCRNLGACAVELRGGVGGSLVSAGERVTLCDIVRRGRRRRESVEVGRRGGCMMGSGSL
jgi:hypothetical protein